MISVNSFCCSEKVFTLMDIWMNRNRFANLHKKNEYVIHIRNLKQALNHEMVLKKLHRVIKFNEKAWLKSCIDINTEVRKKTKNYFEKGIVKQMNNSVFGKTMQNVRKQRDI